MKEKVNEKILSLIENILALSDKEIMEVILVLPETE